MSSQVKIIPADQLNALHTGTLLARLEKLRECEESFQCSDWFCDGEREPDSAFTELIEFKNTDSWKLAFAEVKEVLKKRLTVIHLAPVVAQGLHERRFHHLQNYGRAGRGSKCGPSFEKLL